MNIIRVCGIKLGKVIGVIASFLVRRGPFNSRSSSRMETLERKKETPLSKGSRAQE